jgi:hypothetical protein
LELSFSGGTRAPSLVDEFVVVFSGEGIVGLVVTGEAGFFGLGELDAAGAEFEGLEAGEAVGDGAEFGVVDVWDGRPVGGGGVGVVVR